MQDNLLLSSVAVHFGVFHVILWRKSLKEFLHYRVMVNFLDKWSKSQSCYFLLGKESYNADRQFS